MGERLLIVGAGMATAYLLNELGTREHGRDITVIGDEPQACYNRVLLSNVLSGENAEQDLQMLSADNDAVNFVGQTRIEQIDPEAGRVIASGGESYAYDQLVLATGASVAQPRVECSGLKGVEIFRTLEDTRRLRNITPKGQRALVVGGGLLGLEAAHGLNELGFATTVLHRNPIIMNRQLDAEGGAQLQCELERRGIRFVLGASVSKVQSAANQVTGVRLDTGTALACDLLLFATGITPNTGLAASAGVDCDRGINVDDFLHTSTPGVFALGECSQLGEHCFGLVAPIRKQAAVLARRLCGESGPGFCVEDYPTQLKISGVEIYRAGELDDAAEQLVTQGRGIYRRLVLRDNKLVGAVLVGDKSGGTWYSELIESGRDINALRNGLMFGRDIAEAMLARAA